MKINPNPEVLAWAIHRCRKTPEDFQGAFPKINEWLEGTWNPTLKQLEDFAGKTHISFASLFSADIPSLGLQIADFRTTSLIESDTRISDPSPELFDTIDDPELFSLYHLDSHLP